jgi:hypothetical protein
VAIRRRGRIWTRSVNGCQGCRIILIGMSERKERIVTAIEFGLLPDGGGVENADDPGAVPNRSRWT